MPSRFQPAQDRALGVLDRTFGEVFSVQPMIVFGNKRPEPDVGRAPAAFVAQFFDESSASFGESPGHASNSGQRAVSGRARILFAKDSLPFMLSPPDIVTRTDTGERFQVGDVMLDGLGRLTAMLTARRPAT